MTEKDTNMIRHLFADEWGPNFIGVFSDKNLENDITGECQKTILSLDICSKDVRTEVRALIKGNQNKEIVNPIMTGMVMKAGLLSRELTMYNIVTRHFSKLRTTYLFYEGVAYALLLGARFTRPSLLDDQGHFTNSGLESNKDLLSRDLVEIGEVRVDFDLSSPITQFELGLLNIVRRSGNEFSYNSRKGEIETFVIEYIKKAKEAADTPKHDIRGTHFKNFADQSWMFLNFGERETCRIIEKRLIKEIMIIAESGVLGATPGTSNKKLIEQIRNSVNIYVKHLRDSIVGGTVDELYEIFSLSLGKRMRYSTMERSNVQRHIFSDVIAKWKDLSDFERDFYEKYTEVLVSKDKKKSRSNVISKEDFSDIIVEDDVKKMIRNSVIDTRSFYNTYSMSEYADGYNNWKNSKLEVKDGLVSISLKHNAMGDTDLIKMIPRIPKSYGFEGMALRNNEGEYPTYVIEDDMALKSIYREIVNTIHVSDRILTLDRGLDISMKTKFYMGVSHGINQDELDRYKECKDIANTWKRKFENTNTKKESGWSYSNLINMLNFR